MEELGDSSREELYKIWNGYIWQNGKKNWAVRVTVCQKNVNISSDPDRHTKIERMREKKFLSTQ
jgi:hypothetical protein